jgi:hypothetical protein
MKYEMRLELEHRHMQKAAGVWFMMGRGSVFIIMAKST